MLIYTFQGHLTSFSNVKSITISILELVYQIKGFAVRKGGDGIIQVGVRANE